ncbi:sugar transferase [Desulfurobacterium atlanticum]|uniref:Undecaprenyl-phosphate galactose phosphotransferase n=1 Tax=Desulfurobacterium atlanticum TaxID=240169 RepID=A0A238XQP4_9BACT|nr:sugar transferase [Desulfurobacterium atlanticum]SNR60664.1 undecaprenyl-phosphate galactose phosphotransferase [Desulfurobacterium atlanticum]
MKKEFKIPWWKRPFDVVFSLFAILVTLPIMIPIAAAIKLTDGGSVFFKQKRPGLNGKEFFVYKFRTMYPNNEKILEEYLEKNPEAKKEWELYRKLKSYDPRVTPIGRFLRKYSLDELPQFLNVLKGDMSVVGPRPYIYKEFDDYKIPEDVRKKLLSVKPGVTGLWQVEGRNEATFEDRIKFDLKYVENLSFWKDIKIILKTIWVMLTGKGAY